ncbi:hypothetical protein AAEP93_008992 [Penicillium crustosum]
MRHDSHLNAQKASIQPTWVVAHNFHASGLDHPTVQGSRWSFIPAHRPGSLFAASRFGPACDGFVFLFHCASPRPRRLALFSRARNCVSLFTSHTPYTPDSRAVVQISVV